MNTNEGTGEVYDEDDVSPESESTVLAMMTPAELVEYSPMTPDAIEEAIWQVSERLQLVARTIVILYEERHRAEEAFQKAFSKHVVNSPNKQISFAREYAKFHTADELHELNLAKEKLRYAEEMQKALMAKHYSLMNINKSVTAMYQGGPRRG